MTNSQVEVWLRGPVPDVAPPLQPVVHSLLQSIEEVHRHVALVTREQLWTMPSDTPSAGFHLLHAAGSLDRLTTYARGEQLSKSQLDALVFESSINSRRLNPDDLIAAFTATAECAIEQMKATDIATLTDQRLVGRANLPSTVIGLLFHAAEHTQRHVGQLTTVLRVVTS